MAAPLRPGEPRPAQDSQLAAVARMRRILVVDDNTDAAEMLGMLLEELGWGVVTAHDGEAAVIVSEAFRPDVVLLDIGLPTIDGYEVASAIRAKPWGAAPTLVATTGWALDSDRVRSKEAGFDYHLVKPIDPIALLGFLATLSPDAATTSAA